jgi:hypothetical protein
MDQAVDISRDLIVADTAQYSRVLQIHGLLKAFEVRTVNYAIK